MCTYVHFLFLNFSSSQFSPPEINLFLQPSGNRVMENFTTKLLPVLVGHILWLFKIRARCIHPLICCYDGVIFFASTPRRKTLKNDFLSSTYHRGADVIAPRGSYIFMGNNFVISTFPRYGWLCRPRFWALLTGWLSGFLIRSSVFITANKELFL